MKLLGVIESWIIIIIFLNDVKKAKTFPLAPVVVKILLCRGSAQKIAADNGTILPENA
nr:hypothetical protein [uncultured Flavobacterium sp.]